MFRLRICMGVDGIGKKPHLFGAVPGLGITRMGTKNLGAGGEEVFHPLPGAAA